MIFIFLNFFHYFIKIMIENESETTQNELEIAIQKRNRKYQKPFKNGGGNCCKKYKLLEKSNKENFVFFFRNF